MSLELYQIILLVVIGALVGISISFVGQTGQGVVFPLVFLITGDVFLAIAINVLNDLITFSSPSSKSLKLLLLSPVTGFPSLSITLT